MKGKIKSLYLNGTGIALWFEDQNGTRYSVPQVIRLHDRRELQSTKLSVAADRLINEFKFDVEAFSKREIA